MLRDLRRYDPTYAFVDVEHSEEHDRVCNMTENSVIMQSNINSIRRREGQDNELQTEKVIKNTASPTTDKHKRNNGDLHRHNKRVTFAPVVEMRYFRTV